MLVCYDRALHRSQPEYSSRSWGLIDFFNAGARLRLLALPHDEVQESAQVWEHTAHCCDCANEFDELNNPWGWRSFTTQDMHRSRVNARGEQLRELDRRATLLADICQRIVGEVRLPTPSPTLVAPG